jgi:hypothetical protein
VCGAGPGVLQPSLRVQEGVSRQPSSSWCVCMYSCSGTQSCPLLVLLLYNPCGVHVCPCVWCFNTAALAVLSLCLARQANKKTWVLHPHKKESSRLPWWFGLRRLV